jgi:predicted alpha/beta-fold hydrolase
MTVPQKVPEAANFSESFKPAWYLRNGHIQTVLASSHLRAWGKNNMRRAARSVVLTTDNGTRLLGQYSRHATGKVSGDVVLLHGWEGSAESTYIVCTGDALYRKGYNIFRLNFRDHGDSHHLNEGIFYAVLLEEVFQAVRMVCRRARNRPVFLIGFSLGGNFALRIARQMRHQPIDNLRHVAAISPVLNPASSTARVDQFPLIRNYFLKKWLKSLTKKQHLFPDRYDFTPVVTMGTVLEVTGYLLKRFSQFKSAREYFEQYALLNGALSDLPLETTIITAADDPIIPVEDFYQLELNKRTRLSIHAFGGHNGFIDGIFLKSWYEDVLADKFDEIVEAGKLGV